MFSRTFFLSCLFGVSGFVAAHAALPGVVVGGSEAEGIDREAVCDRLRALSVEYDCLCRDGRFGVAAGFLVEAESLIEQLLGGAVEAEPAWLRLGEAEWAVYHDFLVERAGHRERVGDLGGADATHLRALEFLEHIPRSHPQWKVWRRRTLNNRSILLNLAGRGRASDDHGAAARVLVDSSDSSLIVAANQIRAEVRKGGDVDEALRRLEAIRLRLRNRGRFPASLAVHQQLASTLSEAGRGEEALAAFDTIVAEARALDFGARRAEVLYWRAKARERHEVPGAEADYLECLDYFRAEGVKPREARVYHRYAMFLYEGGRLYEALQVIEESLRLLHVMGAVWNEPDYGAVKAAILLKLGRAEEAEEVWAVILDQVGRLRGELNSTQLRLVLGWRARYVQELGRVGEVPGLRRMAEAWAEEGLLEQEDLDSVLGFIEEFQRSRVAADRGGDAGAAMWREEVVAEPPSVELQPARLISRSVGSKPVRAWFWLLNTSGQTCSGELSITGLGANPTWDQEVEGFLRIQGEDAEVGGMAFPIAITIEPYGSQAVQVVSDALQAGGRARVVLTWRGDAPVTSSEWNLISGDIPQAQSASIRTSLSLRNGFHALPIYHEIGWEGVSGVGLMNFRVKASRPCRVEIYEQPARGLVAVDAQGDGSFGGMGDVLNRDTDRDGYPEAERGILPIVAYVFPVPGVSYDEPLKVTIEVRLTEVWEQWGADWVFEFNR
ncbi:MAG: hypothetical protein RI897_3302 [Verrucomicrobiota bacterium]